MILHDSVIEYKEFNKINQKGKEELKSNEIVASGIQQVR